MNITFSCPRCTQAARLHLAPSATQLTCPHCNSSIDFPPEALIEERVQRCLVCPSTDLFVRKDFPQRLGVGLVAVGILGSCIAWYFRLIAWTFGILFATALVDVVLYLIVGDALMCYRCQAQYRGAEGLDRHGNFNLETHERYRQASARERQMHTS